MSKVGTTTDKIGALSLIIAKDPKYRLQEIEELVQMCNSSNSRVFELSVEATKDLFINFLLPKRKLIEFKEQNLEEINEEIKKINDDKEKKAEIEETLICVYFETNLKAL
jgi:ribosome biogenesis protein MAK21